MKELYAAIDHVMGASSAQGTRRMLLFGLTVHMNVRTFESRPGHALLARYAGIESTKTVQRHLRSLEADEEIAHVRGGRGGRAAVYRILAGFETWNQVDTPSTVHQLGGLGGQAGGQNGGSRWTPQALSTQRERKNNSSFNGSSSGGGHPELIAPALFDEIRRRLADDVGSAFIAHTMVEPLEQLGRAGAVLRVVAPDYCEGDLNRRYGKRLSAHACDVLGEQVDVEIVFEHQLQGGRR